MKSKHLFTPPHKITALFLSGVLVLSCSSCSGAQSSSASETQQQTEVSHSSVGSQEDLSAAEQNLTSVPPALFIALSHRWIRTLPCKNLIAVYMSQWIYNPGNSMQIPAVSFGI